MIIIDRPPNFEMIEHAFPNAKNPGVIFAYDGVIYNPTGNPIPPALIAHENVHLNRQVLHGANGWWEHYITDDGFRYNEELLAHVAELQVFSQGTRDRNAQATLLMRTAQRLIAPLYNYMPPRTLQQALKDLRQEISK